MAHVGRNDGCGRKHAMPPRTWARRPLRPWGGPGGPVESVQASAPSARPRAAGETSVSHPDPARRGSDARYQVIQELSERSGMWRPARLRLPDTPAPRGRGPRRSEEVEASESSTHGPGRPRRPSAARHARTLGDGAEAEPFASSAPLASPRDAVMQSCSPATRPVRSQEILSEARPPLPAAGGGRADRRMNAMNFSDGILNFCRLPLTRRVRPSTLTQSCNSPPRLPANRMLGVRGWAGSCVAIS